MLLVDYQRSIGDVVLIVESFPVHATTAGAAHVTGCKEAEAHRARVLAVVGAAGSGIVCIPGTAIAVGVDHAEVPLLADTNLTFGLGEGVHFKGDEAAHPLIGLKIHAWANRTRFLAVVGATGDLDRSSGGKKSDKFHKILLTSIIDRYLNNKTV